MGSGRFVLQSAALWALLALIGCSSGGDGGGGGGGGGGTDDDIETTVAAAEALSAGFSARCAAEGWPAGADSFAAWAAGQALVDEVSVHPDTHDVTVVYDTGLFHLFHPDDGLDEVAPRTARAAALPAPGRGRFIPSVAAATAATGHPAAVEHYADVIDGLQTMLDAAEEAGYDVPAAPQPASPEWFRTWDEYGLVMVHGHGGFARIRGSDVYCMQTSERFNALLGPGAGWWGELIAGRMGFWSTEGDETQDSFTVTTRYLDHYCPAMPAGSIVYLNCCHSLEQAADPGDVLLGNGVEVLVGWDGLCPRLSAARLAGRFFDRLLGLNDVAPQTPDQRPFVFEDVRDHIVATQTTHFLFDEDEDGTPETPGDWTTRRSTTTGDSTSSGVPVITGGYFVPLSSSYPHSFVTLEGWFGAPQQQVLLGGTACAVNHWEGTTITAEVPEAAGGVGDLVVRCNGLNSNPVRLTRFIGTMDIAVNDPGHYAGTVDVIYGARGITQRIRDEVDGPAETFNGLFDECQLYEDSGTITWDIAGSWTDDEGDLHEVEASGSAPAASTTASSEADVGCILTLDLDTNNAANHRYRLFLTVLVRGTETITTPEGASSTGPWIGVFGMTDPTTAAALPANWQIPGGTFSGDDFTATYSGLVPDPAPNLAAIPARAERRDGNVAGR